mmetsp:Transcript_34235/g.107941  ORF Transcript_34235/g.107941 Transcript_34235/m.107941 type:complete len:110 (-) Transcript_34235:134-463(-)
MRSVVPELESFNDFNGVPFHSRLYKNLKDCIHTGYDNIDNFSRYKDILLYNRTYALQVAQAEVKDDSPAYVKYDAAGKVVATSTVGKLLEGDACPLGAAMIVNNAHIEI